MGLLDDLANQDPAELGDTGAKFIDADTLAKGDERYRLAEINAPEVEKILPDGSYKQGTAGGQVATEVNTKLANELGFTNIKPRLGPNGEPERDHFGRILTDLVDDTGKSFTQAALEAGAYDVNKYTTDAGRVSAALGEARRNQETLEGVDSNPEWTKATQAILEGRQEEGFSNQNFRQVALNEADLALANQFGQGGQYAQGNVQIRRNDRTLQNVARNPWSDSFESGLIGVQESAYGFLNLIGETTGWEGAAEVGEDGVRRAQEKLESYGTRITDYQDVDGFWDAIDYVANNAAMSLPYMALTASSIVTAPALGAVGLGAATAGAVASSAAVVGTAAVYAGQAWNEQEGDNKNATVAISAGIAQATLDRLGLDVVLGKLGPKGAIKEAVNELVKQGNTKAVANKMVAAASKKEIAEFFKDSAAAATRQLEAKKNVVNYVGRTGIGAGGEAITEAGQELIGYTAAHTANGFETFNFEDLQHRLANAAIAGGTLGGVFSAPGTAKDIYEWKSIAHNLGEADSADASQSYRYSEEEKAIYGRIASNQENAAEARARASTRTGASLKERAEEYKFKQKQLGHVDSVIELVKRVPELFKGSVSSITTNDLQARSRTARKIADMFGGNLQRIFSGANYENTISHHKSRLNNIAVASQDFYGTHISGSQTKSKKIAASQELQRVWKAAIDKDGKFDPKKIPDGPKKAAWVQQINSFNAASDAAYQLQKKYNPELGYESNYLTKFKALSAGEIRKDTAGFEKLLMEEFKMSTADAKGLVSNIVDKGQQLDEAFSVIQGGITPGTHKSRTLRLSENPKFDKFLEQDIFENLEEANKQASRFAAHREFVGLDGANISVLLDDVYEELGGGPAAADAVNKMAAQLQNYLDAQSGNYGRATTEQGKTAQRIQKNFMFFTTLAGLPLSAISSFVELGLTSRGITQKDIGQIKNASKEFATTLKGTLAQVGDSTIYNIPGTQEYRWGGPELEKDGQKTGRGWVRELGFETRDTAATTVGATEINPWQKEATEFFFKWNGLQGWTNYTRAVRASLASDFFMDKLKIIHAGRQDIDNPKSKEVQLAEEAMQNLGFDVDFMIRMKEEKEAGLDVDPKDQALYEDSMRDGVFNFINEAVALPQAANRPLIYQDPRFALFTQFQGFMATFTANHIPRMWGEYVKRGSPEMRFSAFKTVITMIALGFLSQHMKDLIKYGWDDDEEFKFANNPNLEAAGYVQRGIRASGLLGTGERVLDKFFPLYSGGGKSDTLGDWVFSSAASESPALSNAKRLTDALGDTLEGEGQKAFGKVLKSAPGIGPFNKLNESLGNILFEGEWNPKR